MQERTAILRPGRVLDLDSAYWDRVARCVARKYYLPQVIAELRKDICHDLLRRWCGEAIFTQRLLKTDVFEEAFAESTFLLELAARNPNITGIDISPVVVARARDKCAARGLTCNFVTSDVRDLPFNDGSFDIVFSHSTLDHFPRESDLLVSLRELQRVLRPGGSLVLVLDNKDNLCDPLVKLASRTVCPFFVGDGYTAEEATGCFDGLQLDCVGVTHIANSPRIVDIGLAKLLGLLNSRRIDAATKCALSRLDRWLVDRRISRLFGTYVAVKAVKRPCLHSHRRGLVAAAVSCPQERASEPSSSWHHGAQGGGGARGGNGHPGGNGDAGGVRSARETRCEAPGEVRLRDEGRAPAGA